MKYATRLSILAALTFAALGLFTPPVRAQQPNGYPITNVNLRAGPGTEYPVLLTVPANAPITILGCLPDYTWCDSVFEGYRGWMSSIYLSGYYEGSYYELRDYAPDLGYQTVSFEIGAYWDSYYRDEPFYAQRARWGGPREEGWMDDSAFYDRLAPYGQWTWTQGRYVWVPTDVGPDWRPYTRGRWVYTDRGWMWVSNEPFGWATYHYGRWGYSDRFGWFWVPGNRWAPAWVSWRQSDDYLAWAPMPPTPDRGININISFGSVPNYYWQTVPSRDFLADDLRGHVIYDRRRYAPILQRTRPIGHTTIVNNRTIVNNVVNVRYVEQTTRKKVVKKKVVRKKTPDQQVAKVNEDAVEVFQPDPEPSKQPKAPPEPKDPDEVAAISKTKGQAKGEATTEDRLVPAEVKEALEKRKVSKAENNKPGPGADARDAKRLDASLPKGEEAKGRPPKAKNEAAKQPVPAQSISSDLGKGKKGKNERSARTAPDAAPDNNAGKPPSENEGAPAAQEPPSGESKESRSSSGDGDSRDAKADKPDQPKGPAGKQGGPQTEDGDSRDKQTDKPDQPKGPVSKQGDAQAGDGDRRKTQTDKPGQPKGGPASKQGDAQAGDGDSRNTQTDKPGQPEGPAVKQGGPQDDAKAPKGGKPETPTGARSNRPGTQSMKPPGKGPAVNKAPSQKPKGNQAAPKPEAKVQGRQGPNQQTNAPQRRGRQAATQPDARKGGQGPNQQTNAHQRKGKQRGKQEEEQQKPPY